MKGDPLETYEEIAKKYHKAKKPAQKNFRQGWTRTHVLLLGRPQKNRNLYAKCQ